MQACLLLASLSASAATLSAAAAAAQPQDRRFGIVLLEGDGTGCALIAEPAMAAGERVGLIVSGPGRHQIVGGVIAGAADEPCPGMASHWREAGEALYRVRVSGNGAGLFAPGILVRFPPRRLSIGRDGRAVGDDLSGAPPLVFSDCTSRDGTHHFVWSGAVGAGRPLWHRYVYVAYDAFVTCTDADRAAIAD